MRFKSNSIFYIYLITLLFSCSGTVSIGGSGIITTVLDRCGNGILDDGEECDGDDISITDCAIFDSNYITGQIKCYPAGHLSECRFDLSSCISIFCGNDIIDAGEDCEVGNLAGNDCTTIGGGYMGGTLSCNPLNCTFDTTNCETETCGNGIIDGEEECDGYDLGSADCTTIPGDFAGGELSCIAAGEPNQCTFNTSACDYCGNDTINEGEECDGIDLGGNDCTDMPEAFDGGTLGCTSGCEFDTSNCEIDSCGNGAIDDGEECDGDLLNGESCTTVGGDFVGGDLACDPESCQFDTGSCVDDPCGNGVIDSGYGEECDGANLGGNDCTTIGLGFTGGTLSCYPDDDINQCSFNTDSCITEVCADYDSDGDNAGLPATDLCPITEVDCNDSNPYIYPTNTNTYCDCSGTYPQGTGSESNCSDGVDNDCDNLVDSGDSDCTVPGDFTFTHLSTENGDLEVPWTGDQQTASLILDVDGDSINDFVIAQRRVSPSVVWYKRNSSGWSRHILESDALHIEASGTYTDIDNDGDLDIVFGADSNDNKIWWWENPLPDNPPTQEWTRRDIKNDGRNKHHDTIFGDFDGDGKDELVFWNQTDSTNGELKIVEVPSDPTVQPWPNINVIYGGGNSYSEGLAKADVNNDGKLDIVGAGRWFEHTSGTNFTAHTVDSGQNYGRAAAGQLIPGGWAELVFGPGDNVNNLNWYEWTGTSWQAHTIKASVNHGHSLQIEDINNDGKLDIFCAEMGDWISGSNPNPKMWVFLGSGTGTFTEELISDNFANHESKVGDLDGDGDIDILGKPFHWNAPRLDVWLQNSTPLPLNNWAAHQIVETDETNGNIFVGSADIDGDAKVDIVTGGWWYKNPGTPGGSWLEHAIGSSFGNMGVIYDFDNDGDMDIFGTQSFGHNLGDDLAWAQNNGSGSFTIHTNLPLGDANDFLQGTLATRLFEGGPIQVILSWHEGASGVQMLTVPSNPTNAWTSNIISTTNQKEEVNYGDIDRDGDHDILLGSKWLRNDSPSFSAHTLFNSGTNEPDRNHLVDMNRDGRLDAVIGYEAINTTGKIAWYEQPSNATDPWQEHTIGTIIGPMSLDVADMDHDGDMDVIVGEHNYNNPASARLFIFENTDGFGGAWDDHLVYTGFEHHDGAQTVDIDGDGDYDILSIGWKSTKVMLFENRAQ